MTEVPAPTIPNSDEEWDLELKAFRAANHQDVPPWAQDIVKLLWKEIVAREPGVELMEAVRG